MLRTKTENHTPAGDGLNEPPLMDGEEVVATIGVNSDGSSASGDIVFLTDKRVICNSGSGSRRSSSFVAIIDIRAVELTRQQPAGYSAFIWAGLAFVVSFMLWRVIENQTISVVAAVAVAIMGIYLIIDRLTTRSEQMLVLNAGGAEVRIEIDGAGRQADAEALINRLFELKEVNSSPQFANASKFSPR